MCTGFCLLLVFFYYLLFFFFFHDTATTEIYTLSLHDALPIYPFASYCRFRVFRWFRLRLCLRMECPHVPLSLTHAPLQAECCSPTVVGIIGGPRDGVFCRPQAIGRCVPMRSLTRKPSVGSGHRLQRLVVPRWRMAARDQTFLWKVRTQCFVLIAV